MYYIQIYSRFVQFNRVYKINKYNSMQKKKRSRTYRRLRLKKHIKIVGSIIAQIGCLLHATNINIYIVLLTTSSCPNREQCELVN